jgi:hypothetical protein
MHQPLDVGIFSTIKSSWRHEWEKALNEWFDEKPHTQPPSSSLNPATELLSPILQHIKSRQISRTFKQAWSDVFSYIDQHPQSTSTSSAHNFNIDQHQ